MKRFYLLMVLVAVGFISFGYGTAVHAANYEIYSYADDGSNSDGGAGYTHAVVSGGDGTSDSWLAESRVNGWELGAKSEFYFDYTKAFESYRPFASANFKQQFNVIDGSVDSTVTFAYDGTLSAYGSDNVSGLYGFSALIEVDHCDSDNPWGQNKYRKYFEKYAEDGFGTWDYDNSFTITYAADELTTGGDFLLKACLNTLYEAEGVWFVGEIIGHDDGGPIYGEPTSGYLDISADFYNSLKLVSVTGGIEAVGAPVPVPGAVWLLGSGLIAIVGIRRRG